MRLSRAALRCSDVPLPPFDPPRRLAVMLEKNPHGFDEFGPRYWTGRVLHCKNPKTATCLVERRDAHPLYKKLVLKSTKYHVHDPDGACLPGDKVLFEKSRPFSKKKHWVFRALLKRDPATEYLRAHPEIAAMNVKAERKRRSNLEAAITAPTAATDGVATATTAGAAGKN